MDLLINMQIVHKALIQYSQDLVQPSLIHVLKPIFHHLHLHVHHVKKKPENG
jgi:hypothetical protein